MAPLIYVISFYVGVDKRSGNGSLIRQGGVERPSPGGGHQIGRPGQQRRTVDSAPGTCSSWRYRGSLVQYSI